MTSYFQEAFYSQILVAIWESTNYANCGQANVSLM